MVQEMSELDVQQNTETVRVEGDHDMFAHYAPKDQITEALVNGVPIVALCGKIWVPSRDPDNFPICPECESTYKAIFGS